jgi:hypothetical protein
MAKPIVKKRGPSLALIIESLATGLAPPEIQKHAAELLKSCTGEDGKIKRPSLNARGRPKSNFGRGHQKKALVWAIDYLAERHRLLGSKSPREDAFKEAARHEVFEERCREIDKRKDLNEEDKSLAKEKQEIHIFSKTHGIEYGTEIATIKRYYREGVSKLRAEEANMARLIDERLPEFEASSKEEARRLSLSTNKIVSAKTIDNRALETALEAMRHRFGKESVFVMKAVYKRGKKALSRGALKPEK